MTRGRRDDSDYKSIDKVCGLLAENGIELGGRVTLPDDGGGLAAVAGDGREAWLEGALRPAIDAARKYVMSSALDQVDWNAELVRGKPRKANQQLKHEPGKGLLGAGGLFAPLAAATLTVAMSVSIQQRGCRQSCASHAA